MNKCLLHPRFSVEQEKSDGSLGIRPVGNFNWSPPITRGHPCKRRRLQKTMSVNGHTFPQETLKHDHIDGLIAALRHAWLVTGCVYSMFKADIDSAFRRIPLLLAHRQQAYVAFRDTEGTKKSGIMQPRLAPLRVYTTGTG